MADDSQERQHAATAKRLAELRKKGTVLRSKDLSGGLIFMLIIFFMIFMTSEFQQKMTHNFICCFTHFDEIIKGEDNIVLFIKHIAVANFLLILPVFLISILITLLSPFIFGGWNFSLDAVRFDLEKLNPFQNLQRLLSPKTALLEIFRSVLKCFFILGAVIYYIYKELTDITNLINLPVKVAIGSCYRLLENFVLLLCCIVVVLVLFDTFYHYWQFQSKTKMSSEELKDEYKDTEGSPDSKRRVRSAQFMLHKQRLNVAVPRAHVVVTNPTHYAIALRYDETKDKAPKVIAKGKDHLAQQIRLLAIANGITIYEAPPLARAIFHTTKVGGEIHSGLYMAVAIVLSYVHQLKNYQLGIGQIPAITNDLKIPEEFNYKE